MITRFLFAVFIFLAFQSCTDKYQVIASRYQFSEKSSVPQYSNFHYWAAHPWKNDPSDSIPKPLLTEPRDSVVDVFFLHPTTYTDARLGWNAGINDGYINAKTDYSSILYQASVFNQYARVFAPRYRQAHLSAFFINNENASTAFDTAYADIKKAFEFYLQYQNNGRPVIIAGHSQGAFLAIRLLKEFFDGRPLQQQLVAAYIVGWPVMQNSFDSIPVCSSPGMTNCFTSWRTFRKGYVPRYINSESPAIVTNPLSWTTDPAYVEARHNEGGVLRDFNKIIKQTAGAQIEGNVLWTKKPEFPGAFFFRTKNYHIGDINLYYMNIRKNVEERIQSFLAKKQNLIKKD